VNAAGALALETCPVEQEQALPDTTVMPSESDTISSPNADEMSKCCVLHWPQSMVKAI